VVTIYDLLLASILGVCGWLASVANPFSYTPSLCCSKLGFPELALLQPETANLSSPAVLGSSTTWRCRHGCSIARRCFAPMLPPFPPPPSSSHPHGARSSDGGRPSSLMPHDEQWRQSSRQEWGSGGADLAASALPPPSPVELVINLAGSALSLERRRAGKARHCGARGEGRERSARACGIWRPSTREDATVQLGMDSDRIRTDTNADVTIYHILFEFRYEYEYYRIRIQNEYFEFGFVFEYLLNLQHRVIMSINYICRWFYNLSNHVTSRE
jgi:hypothetical protein